MEKYYENYLHTGSGWIHAVLSFAENNMAFLYFDLRWMGSELNRCKFTWVHHPQSHSYGLLKLNTIERYMDIESDKTMAENLDEIVGAPDDESRDFYRDITYEYIVLPQSEVWMADAPDIEEMARLGLASWHDSFDLILMLHFSVAMMAGKLNETRLGAALRHLDKMKFKLVAKPVLGYARIQELRKPRISQSENDIPF
jgi:hypothetical protein